MDTAQLDLQDLTKITEMVKAVEAAEHYNVRVNRIDFTIYDEHKVTVSRRGKWQPLRILKVRRLAR